MKVAVYEYEITFTTTQDKYRELKQVIEKVCGKDIPISIKVSRIFEDANIDFVPLKG